MSDIVINRRTHTWKVSPTKYVANFVGAKLLKQAIISRQRKKNEFPRTMPTENYFISRGTGGR